MPREGKGSRLRLVHGTGVCRSATFGDKAARVMPPWLLLLLLHANGLQQSDIQADNFTSLLVTYTHPKYKSNSHNDDEGSRIE